MRVSGGAAGLSPGAHVAALGGGTLTCVGSVTVLQWEASSLDDMQNSPDYLRLQQTLPLSLNSNPQLFNSQLTKLWVFASLP